MTQVSTLSAVLSRKACSSSRRSGPVPLQSVESTKLRNVACPVSPVQAGGGCVVVRGTLQNRERTYRSERHSLSEDRHKHGDEFGVPQRASETPDLSDVMCP